MTPSAPTCRSPVVDDSGEDPTGRTINIFRLTSDPGARKFELANSDQAVHGHPRRDRELDQAHDALVCQRRTSHICDRLAALGGSLRRHEHSTAERAWSSARSAATPTTSSTWTGRLVGDVGWQYKLQAVVRLPLGLSGVGESRLRTRAHIAADENASRRRSRASRPRSSLQPRGELGRLAFGHHHRCPAAEGLRARPRRSSGRLPRRVEPEQRERAAGRWCRPT